MNTIKKIQTATSILNEVITETEQTQWNLSAMAVFLLHNGGSIEIERIPVNSNQKDEITLVKLIALIDAKKLVIAMNFERMRLYKYTHKGLTPIHSFDEVYELLNMESIE